MVLRELEGTLERVNGTVPACPVLPACRLGGSLAEARKALLGLLDGYTVEQLVGAQGARLRARLPLDSLGRRAG